MNLTVHSQRQSRYSKYKINDFKKENVKIEEENLFPIISKENDQRMIIRQVTQKKNKTDSEYHNYISFLNGNLVNYQKDLTKYEKQLKELKTFYTSQQIYRKGLLFVKRKFTKREFTPSTTRKKINVNSFPVSPLYLLNNSFVFITKRKIINKLIPKYNYKNFASFKNKLIRNSSISKNQMRKTLNNNISDKSSRTTLSTQLKKIKKNKNYSIVSENQKMSVVENDINRRKKLSNINPNIMIKSYIINPPKKSPRMLTTNRPILDFNDILLEINNIESKLNKDL